jgi:hypothetical protein
MKAPGIFDRKQIAEYLGLDYDAVKNWSIGRPIHIEPSVRAPGTSGARNVYSTTEVYLMALAHLLVNGIGLRASLAADIIGQVRPEWCERDHRGKLVAHCSVGKPPGVCHYEPGWSVPTEQKREIVTVIRDGRPPVIPNPIVDYDLNIDFRRLLDFVDAVIEANRK